MVLGIETSDLLCSIAFVKKDQILAEYNHEIPRQHAALIGNLVERCGKFLTDSNLASPNFIDDIELVAVAIGPGSFTGLRIGLSYAQGLCLGKDIPIVGINNHQILAEDCPHNYNSVFTMIDARQDEVYLAKMIRKNISYYEIEEHNIVNKNTLTDEITENSALIYGRNIDLNDTITKELLEKHIYITNSARYSAAITAKIGWKQYQQVGDVDLSELEPLYIRSFAGVQ
jgi:tRNA threonylcarbamoyladenosine biosynthesis protein TsaB